MYSFLSLWMMHGGRPDGYLENGPNVKTPHQHASASCRTADTMVALSCAFVHQCFETQLFLFQTGTGRSPPSREFWIVSCWSIITRIDPRRIVESKV